MRAGSGDKRLASRWAALAVSATVLLGGCGGGGDGGNASISPAPTPPTPSSTIEHAVKPTTVDPTVDEATEDHIAVTTTATRTNRLFVFLPGTAGVPSLYRYILQAGARRGYHTLGLNYPSGLIPLGVICVVSNDPDCFWNARREVVTGQDLSADVDIKPQNSIVTRLTKAIDYLDRTYPAEGWGQYLVNGAIDWSKVTMGGHSQGGGHVGVMTKLGASPMRRACYFASPPDAEGPGNARVPAAWHSRPNVTPASLQFGFTGLQDPSVNYDLLTRIWQVMGLSAFGAPVSVDGNSAFNGSHVLTTNATPNNAGAVVGEPEHGLTVRDTFTPLTPSGTPAFDAAWGHLCFQ